MRKIANVGLIGCGHIAETYFRAHKYFNNFKIIKCADINKKAAENCAKTYKIEAVSVNDILKDKTIDIIFYSANLEIFLLIICCCKFAVNLPSSCIVMRCNAKVAT